MDIQVRHCLYDLDCGGYLLLVCFRVLFHIDYQKKEKRKRKRENRGRENKRKRKRKTGFEFKIPSSINGLGKPSAWGPETGAHL